MPITASSGALTYSRTSLGDPNFTYWLFKATGVTGDVKDVYLDNTNSILYVQSSTSTGPNLYKIDGFIGPFPNYNKTYNISATSYGFMGYMGYDTTTDEIVIPIRMNYTNSNVPPRIRGDSVLIYIDSNNGNTSTNYRREAFNVPVPTPDNALYVDVFQTAFNTVGDLYSCHLDVYTTTNTAQLRALRYQNAPSAGFNGTLQINPNPYGESFNNTFGKMIFDSTNQTISSVTVYGTTLNEVRWYTNSTTAGSAPGYNLPTINACVFTLANKRLQSQGLALDSSENRVGVIYNPTDSNSFLVKTNTSHSVTWQRRISGVQIYNVTVDSSDNIYVAGLITSNGRVYIAKFNSSGTVQWQNQLYGTGPYTVPTIECDSLDELIISCSDNSNPLVMRLPSDGSKTGSYILGTSTIIYSSVSQTIASGTLTVATPVNTVSASSNAPYDDNATITITTGALTYNRTPVT
jgi:hypothetical protein